MNIVFQRNLIAALAALVWAISAHPVHAATPTPAQKNEAKTLVTPSAQAHAWDNAIVRSGRAWKIVSIQISKIPD